MLTAIEHHSNIMLARGNFTWGDELERIVALVARYFPDFNGNGFYPHPDEIALQGELQALPTLRHLAQRLGRAGARGVAISNLGLAALGEAQRNAVLYAIALCRGFPTSTDQRTRRVAWDVRARQSAPAAARFVTFSERVGAADMHTDSSFYPMPEEQFLLYVVAAARCQGGASLLIEVDDIAHELQRTPAGRTAFAMLGATPVPFRVPSVYAAKDEQVEYHQAPVFQRQRDGSLGMRWRYDAICKGLEARPQQRTPALLAALALLNEVIEERAPRLERQLPDDTLLWVDNQRVLHGRAMYSDPARHLIRIRISNIPNANRIGPSGLSAD